MFLIKTFRFQIPTLLTINAYKYIYIYIRDIKHKDYGRRIKLKTKKMSMIL